jgi:polyisoprenoid-binding protein YceI
MDGISSHTFGAHSGTLLIKTGRTGMGAKAGHDLTIEVTRWHGEARVDPAEPAASHVTVEADPASLAVREGTGGVKALTDSDRAEIERNIREKALRTDRPITFRSTSVAGTPEAFQIEGELTIGATTAPLTVRGRLTGDRVSGSATVAQSRWGIKPYSAFLGALKLRDEVEVAFDVGLKPA